MIPDSVTFRKRVSLTNRAITHSQADLVATFVELKEGSTAVVTNGRVLTLSTEQARARSGGEEAIACPWFRWGATPKISLHSSLASFTQDDTVSPASVQALDTSASDFELLETLEWRDRGKAVWAIVNGANLEVADVDALTSELWSDVAMAASSVAAVRQQAARFYGGGQDILQGLERESAAITSEHPDAVVSIDGCLDPLSPEAQKLAPILLVLREQLGSSLALRLALNPARDVGGLPIKSYYRYAAPALPTAAPPAAFFDGLPTTKTLTLGMDVAEMWLVAPAVAAYDLDNLRLEDLGSAKGMNAEFELENILVTGARFSVEGPRVVCC